MADETKNPTDNAGDTGEEVGGMPAGGLYGSSVQPSTVLIGGKEEPLGVAVGAAFGKSGLTGNAWNVLPDTEREKLVAAEIDPPPAKGRRVRRQVTAPVLNTLTATTSPQTSVLDEDVTELPASVKLAAPYAYYDDAGELHSWLQGSEIADTDTIALLVERGAIFEA